MLLSGLPELMDSDPSNNKRGWIFAAIDGAALTSGATTLSLATIFRQSYASTGVQNALDWANGMRWTGIGFLAGLVLLRAAAVYGYWRYSTSPKEAGHVRDN